MLRVNELRKYQVIPRPWNLAAPLGAVVVEAYGRHSRSLNGTRRHPGPGRTVPISSNVTIPDEVVSVVS